MPGVKSRPAAPAPRSIILPFPGNKRPQLFRKTSVAEQGKAAFTEIGSQTFFAGQKSSVFVNMQLYQFAAFTT